MLVDDFSTDQTPEIALAAGSKVRFFQHAMDVASGFAGQRNIAIENTQSTWILHMDIDERVSPALAQEIIQVIQLSYNGYRYRRLNYFLHRPMRGGGLQYWNNPQLARNGHHHFKNAIHEVCVVEGAVGQLQHPMLHLNDTDYLERMRKSFQYCQLEATKLLQSGKRVHTIDLILQPIITFTKLYFLRQGFRDSTPGIIFALHSADATFRAYALAWDEQNRILRESLEAELSAQWKQKR